MKKEKQLWFVRDDVCSWKEGKKNVSITTKTWDWLSSICRRRLEDREFGITSVTLNGSEKNYSLIIT